MFSDCSFCDVSKSNILVSKNFKVISIWMLLYYYYYHYYYYIK
jgi:hypothetical protein